MQTTLTSDLPLVRTTHTTGDASPDADPDDSGSIGADKHPELAARARAVLRHELSPGSMRRLCAHLMGLLSYDLELSGRAALSQKEIADWCDCSLSTARRATGILCELGLLTKHFVRGLVGAEPTDPNWLSHLEYSIGPRLSAEEVGQ